MGIDPDIRSDIENFICENPQCVDTTKFVGGKRVPVEVKDLTPQQKLNFMLHWNGLIGWTDKVIRAVEQFGWKLQDGGHTRLKHEACEDPHCNICEGGLFACTVCGGGEASLPTQCPIRRMTDEEEEAVLNGTLDFHSGKWWIRYGGER